MKVRIMIILPVIFVILGFIFIGCIRDNDFNTLNTDSKTVITIWTKDRHDAAYQKARIKKYNDTNMDNIVVEYKIFSDNYLQALDSAFQSNNAPDIIAYTDQVFNQFYAQNYFADIMPNMDEEFKSSFESVFIDGVNVFNGKCYFIPTCATTPRLFYNKTLFEKAGIKNPPVTIEEMIDDAKLITNKYSSEGIYGFAANMNNAKSAMDRSLIEMANREIGIKSGYDFKYGRYDFTGYEPIIENWRILLSSECAYPKCSELDIDPLRQMFAEGKIGMYISYIHSEVGVYQKQFPMEDEWGCVEIPTSNGVIKGAQNYSLNNGYLFNRSCENLETAWKVYQALFGDLDYLREYYEMGFGIPVIAKVIENADKDGYKPKYETMLLGNNDKMWPKTPAEENSEAVLIDGLDFYEVFKELIFSNKDVSSELSELSERYNNAYKNGIDNSIGRAIKIDEFNSMNPEIVYEER